MSELHRGIDLRAAVGTPVLAPIDGVIAGQWNEPEGGICLLLAGRCRDGTYPDPRSYFFQSMATEGKGGHDDSGWRVTFAHLSNYAGQLGAVVKRGDVVAYSGQTGARPDGSPVAPHLHMMVEWLEDGWIDARTFVDPKLLLGDVISHPGAVNRLPAGVRVAPQAAIIQPVNAPAAQGKRESVVINVDGNGLASVNMGNGASIAGTVTNNVGL